MKRPNGPPVLSSGREHGEGRSDATCGRWKLGLRQADVRRADAGKVVCRVVSVSESVITGRGVAKVRAEQGRAGKSAAVTSVLWLSRRSDAGCDLAGEMTKAATLLGGQRQTLVSLIGCALSRWPAADVRGCVFLLRWRCGRQCGEDGGQGRAVAQ